MINTVRLAIWEAIHPVAWVTRDRDTLTPMALQRLTASGLFATLRTHAYTTHAPTVFDKM